jgi:Tetracyclin repressor-like, C-terminal domain
MRLPRLRARIEATQDADRAGPPDQSFEFGLRAILDGLEVQLAARPVPAS